MTAEASCLAAGPRRCRFKLRNPESNSTAQIGFGKDGILVSRNILACCHGNSVAATNSSTPSGVTHF